MKLFAYPARHKHVVRAPAHLLSGIARFPEVRPGLHYRRFAQRRADSATAGTRARRAAPDCWPRSRRRRNGARKHAATTPTGPSTGPTGSTSGSAPKTRSPPRGVNTTGSPGPAPYSTTFSHPSKSARHGNRGASTASAPPSAPSCTGHHQAHTARHVQQPRRGPSRTRQTPRTRNGNPATARRIRLARLAPSSSRHPAPGQSSPYLMRTWCRTRCPWRRPVIAAVRYVA